MLSLKKIRKLSRQFCIIWAVIGEVASQLLPEVELLSPEIPWVDIRGIRNLIIHEYFRVNLNIIWETIQTDLPPLVHQLEELLERLK